MDNLKVDALWYAVLMGAMSVGTIIGSIVISIIKPAANVRVKYLLGSILLMAMTLCALGLSESTWVSLLLLMVMGMCTGIFNLQAMTLFQLTPPAELRGRVMSFVMSATGAMMPLGLLLGGALGEWTDNDAMFVFIFTGVCIALTTIVAAFHQNFKRFLATDTNSEPEVIVASDEPATES